MARPKKENLDYFPFDADFFWDIKISRLKAQFGTDGICVYLFILCRIYKNSYYIELNDDLVLDITERFSFSESKTRQIINCLLSRSLLVSIPVESVKMLSATSIQRRYQEAKKGAKRDIEVDERLWLLSGEETEAFIKVRPSDGFSGNNGSISGKNRGFSGKNGTKESKEKESKEKESIVKESVVKGSKVCMTLPCKDGVFEVTDDYLNTLTHTYPNMKVEDALTRMKYYLTANPEKQRLTNTLTAYIDMWLSRDHENGRFRIPPKSYEATYDLSEYESTSITDYLEE